MGFFGIFGKEKTKLIHLWEVSLIFLMQTFSLYAKIYFEKQLKMVILVLLVFMEDTKVVFNYSFGARLI